MTTPRKVRLDQDSITFRELAAIEEELGVSLSSLFETSQARGPRPSSGSRSVRDDPSFTYDQALDLGPGILEQSTPDPEVPSVANGDAPPSSPERGDSIRTA